MDKYELRRLRFIELCNSKYGGKIASLAMAIGRDASYVSRMMYQEGKAGRKRIGEDMCEHIERECNVWGWFDNAPSSPAEPSNVTPALDTRGRVPVISWVQAGDWQNAVDNFHPGHAEEWVDITCPQKAHTFALRVKGDSMVSPSGAPSFPEGFILVVEPEMDFAPGDFVVAMNGDEEATFKQIVKDGGDWYLKPLNPNYRMKPLGNAKIVGVVREAILKFK